jgi:hypothetical protein
MEVSNSSHRSGRNSQDLRLILSATCRAQNPSDYCLYEMDSAVLRNRRVSLKGEVRVSLIGNTRSDLAQLKLATLRRSQEIPFAITFDFRQGAWFGEDRAILLGRQPGVIG